MDSYTDKFGNTPYAVWLGEVISDCIREDGSRVSVQMNLLPRKGESRAGMRAIRDPAPRPRNRE